MKPFWSKLALITLLGAHLPAHAADADSGDPRWIGSWSASPQPPLNGTLAHYRNQSLRLVVHTSTGGAQWRIRLSNRFGDRPLVIGAAHLARRAQGAGVDPASDRRLSFDGRAAVTVPAHGSVLSDPVALDAPALSDLAVSLYLPQPTAATSTHFMALQTSYVAHATGDATAAAQWPAARVITSWPFLAAVEVQADSPRAKTVVVLGDSQVDGDGATPDANRRFTDRLAERLVGRPGAAEVGVLNQGLIGNRLLRDSPRGKRNPVGPGFGPSGLARFDIDALDQPGISAVILRLGTNDIGFPGSFAPPAELPSAEQLIAGYRQLIARARQRSVRIIGSTLAPFENTSLEPGYYTPAKEPLRQAVNAWMRHGNEFDAVIDADQVLRDPEHPTRLLPTYDSGDHLHPNDAGYAAMANAVPLTALGLE